MNLESQNVRLVHFECPPQRGEKAGCDPTPPPPVCVSNGHDVMSAHVSVLVVSLLGAGTKGAPFRKGSMRGQLSN